jgi:uncharacterized protein (TIGR03437 family)
MVIRTKRGCGLADTPSLDPRPRNRASLSGFLGLNQVNVTIPIGIPNAADVPVFITAGGKVGNTVTLSVQ